MPPKVSQETRVADDGQTIEQRCNKCQNWKEQLEHFKSARGNKIVATCQKCRDDGEVYDATRARNRSALGRQEAGESSAMGAAGAVYLSILKP